MVVVSLMQHVVVVILVQRLVFCRRGVTFIYFKTIQPSKIYFIRDNKSNKWLLICYIIRVIGILVIIVISNI